MRTQVLSTTTRFTGEGRPESALGRSRRFKSCIAHHFPLAYVKSDESKPMDMEFQGLYRSSLLKIHKSLYSVVQ